MDTKKIRFGTDGIRGHAEQFPFNGQATNRLGNAIGTWVVKKYGPHTTALIGSDTRVSCTSIKQALCEGLAHAGVQCIDAGVLPTPAVLGIIKHNPSMQLGIMISASHNPYHDNGIKLFDHISGKITRDEEKEIEALFTQAQYFSVPLAPLTASTRIQRDHYELMMHSHFPANLLAGHTIVLDCANGATYAIAPQIFRALGAKVIALAIEPNGVNINANCGALHPASLQQAVKLHNALIGFAFDGDGDRVIAVNHAGLLRDGDDLLALLLDHPACKQIAQVVGTVMTNHGFDAHVQARGLKLIRTKVGDKHIATELTKNKQVLGGEASGHIIMTDYLPTGDGIFVALRVAQTILATNNRDFITFQKYPQTLINVPITHKDDLQKPVYRSIIARYEQQIPAGRIVVRYSGTENLLRVMVEDAQEQSAHTIALSLARDLQSQLENK